VALTPEEIEQRFTNAGWNIDDAFPGYLEGVMNFS
jgi:hypothetical protein